MAKSHNAEDSYIGYIFQGEYALLILFDADYESKVSIETSDDVTLIGSVPTLHQIKHTLASKPGTLTIKNDGLWNTLEIWVTHPDTQTANFVFVTSASVKSNDILECLCADRAQQRDTKLLAQALLKEAQRVIYERELAKNNNEKLPYKDRASACEEILKLGEQGLETLLTRTTILDGSCNAFNIPEEVKERLKNHVPLERREPIAERLLEWWERRVAKALLNKNREKNISEISKQELLARINQLIIECSEDNLPDDYSSIDPQREDIDSLSNGMMEEQINLVNGKSHRVARAARYRWQAINQRHRWMTYDLSLAHEIDKFDKRLFDEWNDKYSIMVQENEGECDGKLAEEGLKILDWTHDEAPFKIPHIKSSWQHPFITRGSYQELANSGKIGWHPLYKKILFTDKGKKA